jgi:hypothetical protein
MRKLWVLVMGLLMSIAAIAEVVTLKPGVPERYVVQKGDTLWDISRLYLEDPWRWSDIWYINPQIANPHLIYPGDVLGFVVVDGETKITTISRTVVVVPEDTGPVTLKPQVRSSEIQGAIPAIPRDKIASFLSNNRIMTQAEITASPYIIGGYEGRLVLGMNDKIYARGDFGDQALPAYEVFRPGVSYVDPETGEELGLEVRGLGMASFISLENTVATLKIQRSTENIRLKDRLMSSAQDVLIGTYYPKAPEEDIRGEILAVLRGVSSIGQYDVVLLNRGLREGLEAGHVFNIWRRGELVNDPIAEELVRLPSEVGGVLMVFKAFDKMSYGLVLDARRPLSIGDEVRAPGF